MIFNSCLYGKSNPEIHTLKGLVKNLGGREEQIKKVGFINIFTKEKLSG